LAAESDEVASLHRFFQLKAGIYSSSSSRYSEFPVCFQEVVFSLSGFLNKSHQHPLRTTKGQFGGKRGGILYSI